MTRQLHSPRPVWLIGALLASLLACLEPSTGPGISRRGPTDPSDTWVLFIGNSHTEIHNIPAMVQAIAAQAGNSTLRVEAITGGGMALEDHWWIGAAPKALREYEWDFVVMQQGPSSLRENQAHLRYWTLEFTPLIRAAGAEPVLYQIWPSAWRRQDAENALFSYTQAAAAAEGLLAPAGDGLTAALELPNPLPVYSGDAVHASEYGAYIAALTIAARVAGVHPESLPPVVPGWTLHEQTVRQLQAAAATALARNPARP